MHEYKENEQKKKRPKKKIEKKATTRTTTIASLPAKLIPLLRFVFEEVGADKGFCGREGDESDASPLPLPPPPPTPSGPSDPALRFLGRVMVPGEGTMGGLLDVLLLLLLRDFPLLMLEVVGVVWWL